MKKKIFDLILSIDSTVKQAMQKIEKNASGIVFIFDGDKKLVGSLSDGDIRRYILNDGKIDDVVNQAMNKSCTSATEDLSTGEILRLMDMGLKLIPVIDEKGELLIFMTGFLWQWFQELPNLSWKSAGSNNFLWGR